MSDNELLLALIVEDEHEAATILKATLQSAGFETAIARDGEAALVHLGMVVPTLVVLDLALPGVPGADILRRIRDDERLKECPVIVVTGVPVLIEGVREEADLVLVKPFSIGQLREFARYLAENRTADR